jgi:hypothetical protein
MDFKLVDSGWGKVLDEAICVDGSQVRILCPFIKERAARRFLVHGQPKLFQVITRFDLDGFLEGASDLGALRLLLKAGAQIRGIRNLHAKTYLIGKRAIVTSANLTEQALNRNHEFGFAAEDPEIVTQCHGYFDRLWRRAGRDLTHTRLEAWEHKVEMSLATGAGSRLCPKLGDEGADVGIKADFSASPLNWVTTAGQGFVKFFGEGHNRLGRDFSVLSEVDRAGCHWACSYPSSKRPRQVQDGAILFMGRLVARPNDTMIFGRAIGMKYQDGRDDATDADIKKRTWKVKWPRYIRVHDAEFIDGTLGNGISLSELMDDLGANAFASTKRNLEAGVGNTNPRTAYAQQAQVELSPAAIGWLNSRFDQTLKRFGRISRDQLAKLDWPRIPGIKG